MIRVEEALKRAQKVKAELDAKKAEEEKKKALFEEKAKCKGVQILKNAGQEMIETMIEKGLSIGGEVIRCIKIENCEMDDKYLYDVKSYFEDYGYKCSIKSKSKWNGQEDRYWSEVELTLGF